MQGYNMEEASLLDSPLRRESIWQNPIPFMILKKQFSVENYKIMGKYKEENNHYLLI